jgi:AcrR family transcriptional regulator
MIAAERRVRLPRAERVQQVLDAAARAFARSGYAATSMEQIAAEAGISKLMLYRDFEGKRELYLAVLERLRRRLSELVGDDPEGGASQRGIEALFRAAREQPAAFVLMFRHAAREPEFAGYAEQFLAEADRRGEERLAAEIDDPVLRRWTARVAARTMFEAVIAWLEVGDPARDAAFLAALSGTSMRRGQFASWAVRAATAASPQAPRTRR